jgi:hypothetical protein
MNYAKSYLNLSENIRETAKTGRRNPTGLGARVSQEPLEVPQEDIQQRYMSMVKSIFTERKAPKKEEIETYLDPVEMSDSEMAPTSSPKPKGRGAVPRGEVPDYIYRGLIERGVPEHVAQGMLMNIKDESGFKANVEEYEPNVHGTKGKGLYQLTGDRREVFEARYGENYSIDNQLDWLMHEWQNTEKSAFDKIMSTRTAGEAGAAIVTYFLRPAAQHRKKRAQKYINATPYLPSN